MSLNDIRLQTHVDSGILVIAPEGNILGGQGTQDLRKCIQDALKDGSAKIVLDLSRVEFVNSMGLGVFLSIRAMVSRQKGTILLAAPSTHVADLFRLTQADQVFPIYESVSKAVKVCIKQK